MLPPRLTDSAIALRQAAQRRGLDTVQLPTFEVPHGLRAEHVHAGPRFADAVASTLGIALLEAPADWLANLPETWTRRVRNLHKAPRQNQTVIWRLSRGIEQHPDLL